MEEWLRKLKIQSPPPDLRERVLASANAEWHRAAGKRHWLDQLWESRAFWGAAAAAALVSLAAIFTAPASAFAHEKGLPPPNESAVAMAQELAGDLGGDPALEQLLAAQLSRPSPPAFDSISLDELTRELQ